MQLNSDQLAEVTRVAAAAYTPKEVAYILGLPVKEFVAAVQDEASEVNAAYFKGFFSTELKVRESVITLAVSGSSPAQAAAKNLIDYARQQLIREDYPGFGCE